VLKHKNGFFFSKWRSLLPLVARAVRRGGVPSQSILPGRDIVTIRTRERLLASVLQVVPPGVARVPRRVPARSAEEHLGTGLGPHPHPQEAFEKAGKPGRAPACHDDRLGKTTVGEKRIKYALKNVVK
jgi:hypothetical protein